jgi:hypothetical protein
MQPIARAHAIPDSRDRRRPWVETQSTLFGIRDWNGDQLKQPLRLLSGFECPDFFSDDSARLVFAVPAADQHDCRSGSRRSRNNGSLNASSLRPHSHKRAFGSHERRRQGRE